jgi:hypothetical protein
MAIDWEKKYKERTDLYYKLEKEHTAKCAELEKLQTEYEECMELAIRLRESIKGAQVDSTEAAA